MSEIIETEAVVSDNRKPEAVKTLADRVDTARAADPDAARRLLWSIARRHGREIALAVARELCRRTLAAFADQLDRAA